MNLLECRIPATAEPEHNDANPRLAAAVWCRSVDIDWVRSNIPTEYCLNIWVKYPRSQVMFEQPFNSVDDLPQAPAEMGKGIAEYLEERANHD